MVYLIIILGQLIYEYCFDDDFQNYEDINWIEFMFSYVVSSFSEAFSEILQVVNNIFLRPV